jgi:hypothetical protein
VVSREREECWIGKSGRKSGRACYDIPAQEGLQEVMVDRSVPCSNCAGLF